MLYSTEITNQLQEYLAQKHDENLITRGWEIDSNNILVMSFVVKDTGEDYQVTFNHRMYLNAVAYMATHPIED